MHNYEKDGVPQEDTLTVQNVQLVGAPKGGADAERVNSWTTLPVDSSRREATRGGALTRPPQIFYGDFVKLRDYQEQLSLVCLAA